MSLCKTCFHSTRAWSGYGIVFCGVMQNTITGEVVRCDHHRPRGRVTLATKFPKVRLPCRAQVHASERLVLLGTRERRGGTMISYHCPYCGEGIEDETWYEMPLEEDYEVECPECEREFSVSYSIDPSFYVRIPDELACCHGCDLWNGTDECCGRNDPVFTERRNRILACGLLGPAAPMEGCPLGHDKEATDER